MDNISEVAEDRMYQEYLNSELRFPEWAEMNEPENKDDNKEGKCIS